MTNVLYYDKRDKQEVPRPHYSRRIDALRMTDGTGPTVPRSITVSPLNAPRLIEGTWAP